MYLLRSRKWIFIYSTNEFWALYALNNKYKSQNERLLQFELCYKDFVMCALLHTAVTNILSYNIVITFVAVGHVFTELNSATTLSRETSLCTTRKSFSLMYKSQFMSLRKLFYLYVCIFYFWQNGKLTNAFIFWPWGNDESSVGKWIGYGMVYR